MNHKKLERHRNQITDNNLNLVRNGNNEVYKEHKVIGRKKKDHTI